MQHLEVSLCGTTHIVVVRRQMVKRTAIYRCELPTTNRCVFLVSIFHCRSLPLYFYMYYSAPLVLQ